MGSNLEVYISKSYMWVSCICKIICILCQGSMYITFHNCCTVYYVHYNSSSPDNLDIFTESFKLRKLSILLLNAWLLDLHLCLLDSN